MSEENIMFVHSLCCTAHWELVYDKEKDIYGIFCENCGKEGLFFKNEKFNSEQKDELIKTVKKFHIELNEEEKDPIKSEEFDEVGEF